ncbi:hypothetical protein BLA39750_01164 [Burkholderia lata]|uniref:Uncharacterized protein n=1 Tax=Burkholderia lata (strain ATCC 17760 / DSM 23089 / LMG 22485 / NCIMB 9086 / R18194 / 383) TaxID=482957 RepID=A0A6P2UYQ6_BURL3|nr:hypothetical protein [Burkholderia lata]VWC80517.1 hypothetical protein BLA39750_01164 [Burkholderia lata]
MTDHFDRHIRLIDEEIAKLKEKRVLLVRGRKKCLKLGRHDGVPAGTTGKLVTLDGRPVTATYEKVYGKSGLSSAMRMPDGSLDINYDYEGSRWFLDGQLTVKNSLDEITFLDEDGDLVDESQVKVVSLESGDEAGESSAG